MLIENKIDSIIKTINIIIDSFEVDKKNFGEVMTPYFLVNEMLDSLPNSVWSDKKIKWFDPCCGVGVFQSIIIKRLFNGLRDIIEDEEERYKHILENMIYVSEIQEKNIQKLKELFNSNNEYSLNTYCGDFLDDSFDEHMKNIWNIECFDVVVMNSPYQKPSEGEHNRSRPMYNLFIEKGLDISNKLLSVHPTRWMGKSIGLNDFRDRIFSRRDLKLIRTYTNAKKVFGGNVELRGGIHYFYIDKEYDGFVDFDGEMTKLSEFDVYVKPEFHNILNKIISNNNLSNICQSNSVFMNFNHKELSDVAKDGFIKCYVSKQKGEVKYIEVNRICNRGQKIINDWKVFTPFAAGYGVRFNFFGNKILGYPGEVCSNTFLTLIVNNKEEAESLISYMETKFCNFFLSLRKTSQNMNRKTLLWIPIVPFDREWTDEMLFKYFKLTDEEIKIIS